MQAIISDIIVSQTRQTGNLQISQPINNISSNSFTFADMLESLNQSSQEKPLDESSKVNQSAQSKESQESKAVEDSKSSQESQKPQDEKLSKDKALTQEEESSVKKSQDKVQVKNIPVKNSGEIEDEEKNPAGNKVEVKKNALDTGKKVIKDDKKTLTDEQKKSLLDKEKLELIKQEAEAGEDSSVNQKGQENAALAGELVQTPVDENAGNEFYKQEKEGDFLLEDMSLASKTDAGKKAAFEANSVKEKISVLDFRTKPVQEAQNSKNIEKSAKNLKVEFKADNTANITMEIDQQMQAVGENILSLDNQTAASDGSNFQAMVNNQIQANIPDFVQTGTVLLKDNNKGTINLTLHPDDLGNVKIHLSMDGKTVSAHITVNTKEALEVFKDNAQTLREAFAKNGFDTASFDVSYNGSSNGQSGQDFKGLYDGSEFMARNAYSDFLGGGNDDGYIQDYMENAGNSEYLINIVA